MRMVALPLCNTMDRIRLKWHRFKRSIMFMIKRKKRLEIEMNEDQKVLCSQVIREFEAQKKEKIALELIH